MPANRSRIRTVAKILLKTVAVVFAASVALVVLLRFVSPPFSALMIERRVESWWTERAYRPQYDWVSLSEIAPVMGAAVISAEDQRFSDHFGFDWNAIEKAFARNLNNNRLRGGSTLSQQTAKNLFLWSGRTWLRKGVEAYFTLLLESCWPKRRILETYLNIVEFGDGVYGVEAASQKYFHKPALKLNASEAAMLAAVLPNPRRYKVNAPSDYVLSRQQWILDQLRQLGGTALIRELQ